MTTNAQTIHVTLPGLFTCISKGSTANLSKVVKSLRGGLLGDAEVSVSNFASNATVTLDVPDPAGYFAEQAAEAGQTPEAFIIGHLLWAAIGDLHTR